MSITHFVYLLFSFQRPNPTSNFVSLFRSRDRVSTSASRNRQEKFRRIFQPVFNLAAGFLLPFPPSRALYLATARSQVNRKNLLPVDFFRGASTATRTAKSEALCSNSRRRVKGRSARLLAGLTEALGPRIICRVPS